MVVVALSLAAAAGVIVWKIAMAGVLAGVVAGLGAFTISLSLYRSTLLAHIRRRAARRIADVGDEAFALLESTPDEWPLLSAGALDFGDLHR